MTAVICLEPFALKKLAKQLNLSVSPCALKAGTAVAGQPVEVLGKAKPF